MEDKHNPDEVHPEPSETEVPAPEPTDVLPPEDSQPIASVSDVHVGNQDGVVDMASSMASDSSGDTPPAEPVIVASKKKRSFFKPEMIFIPALRRRLGTKARPLGLIAIIVILAGLGSLSYWRLVVYHTPSSNNGQIITSSFKLPVTAFKLVSTLPASGDTNVSTNSTLTLNFNQAVTPNKLVNNMFVTPTVAGTYKQGSTPDQVIFTPSTAFSQGTKVSVMVNGSYESNAGSQLGSAYGYSFTTAIPGDGILFQDQNGLIDQVSSLESGQSENYTMLIGGSVGSGTNVTLYKGNVTAMLNSLVYSATSGVSNFSNLVVPTSGLTKVSSQAISNNQGYKVQEPDGLYVAVATDSTGKEVGLVWIDFSNFGVLLRQDDQKIVAVAQQFSSSASVSADVSFYNLNNQVNLLSSSTVNGLTSLNFPYSPSVDLAVATYNGETSIIPINITDSGADIRVDQNLSTAQQVYGITDKPTYKVGETVNYAGFVRTDNDAQYINPGSGTVNLYIAQYKGGTPLASFSASVDSNGMFSGSITSQASWLNSGDIYDQLQIFESSPDGNSRNDLPLAGFVLTSGANASSNISVSFAQPSYLPNNQITATISATNSSGQPLANQTLEVHTFSEDYYENDPVANLENFGYIGDELPNSPVSVHLNASGQATYTISASSLPADGNSQLVTVQANLPDQTGVGAAGGASTIVHQGNAILTFGLTRNQIPTGSSLVSDVYATTLTGAPMTSSTIKYSLVNNSSEATLTSGSISTNAEGLAEITIPSSQLSSTDSMELKVSTEDSSGNTIGAATYYSVQPPASNDQYDTSGAALFNLNVTGSSGNIAVGSTVTLNINSPSSINAMVSMDRGRIYNPAMLSLNQGNNTYSFTVTANMAPSFTLTFNYFLNGDYQSEGVPFTVSESAQAANVKISTPASAVVAGKSLTLPITTTGSNGNPLQTSMIVDVVSANTYSLSNEVNPSIFATLFNPRPIMTSSSSSLLPVGSGGGRCGGGGGDLPSYTNPDGTVLDWQPEITTSSSGQASVTFTPTKGSWIVSIYAMSSGTQVGSASTTITAN